MNRSAIKNKALKILGRLFDTRAAGFYILAFAFSIGIATFVENDFGTSAAQKIIFKSRWFELLLFLFSVALLVNIWKFRIIQNKKWPLLIFHTSMIVIFIGAGITRYFSFEGMMHIRENDSSNNFLTSDTYLLFEVLKNGQKYNFDEPVLFASLGDNNWHQDYQVGNDIIDIEVTQFIPNPKQVITESDNGIPTIKIVFGSESGRQEYFLQQGESRNIRNVMFDFSGQPKAGAININLKDNALTLETNKVLTQMVMATQERDTLIPGNGPHTLRLRAMYSDGLNSFVFGDFNSSGIVEIVSEDEKVKNESMTALRMKVRVNGKEEETVVYGKKAMQGQLSIVRFPELSLAISYGAKNMELPFRIGLYDFIMERYPGTNSAASYASEVQLIDDRNNYREDYRIYMNHILDYDGYRFFQSSFDQDELGTYLSVNHDFWGTWISYLGYFLLTLGLLMVFVSKKTRFYQVTQNLKKLNASVVLILALFLFSPTGQSQKQIQLQLNEINKDHAALFSRMIVQDHKGRMKPIHTLSREVLRKIARKETIGNQNADQVVLGMFADKQNWISQPMIKLGNHQRIKDLLGVQSDFASYKDFFKTTGDYKLREEVRRAYGLQPIDRGMLEKEIMKIDERLNIASMIYSGRLFKIIPVPNDPNNYWVSSFLNEHGEESIEQPVAERFFPAYKNALIQSQVTNNYSLPNQMLHELEDYQSLHGAQVVPGTVKTKLEILLNNLNVFGRLSLYYILMGLVFLSLLFYSVFSPNKNLSKFIKYLFWAVLALFAFHTLGLGLRWYVSGRAPWSNGYESMIYIAWTSCLAGLIFTKKSEGGLAATMVLAGTILLVAKLSYLDPEITPLVPVLKSYWLTIHVSLIAGSYGFLMLGAIIGLINLILFMFLNEGNKTNIKRIVTELSYISEITLIGGLTMISIGTYLGGVWANESWGRYWGWDAKETWALVTILVYAFILHMRIIPKMNGLYTYNLAKLFGWASVIMTYFGVNYYLSGLHSYAAGDPVPIPTWVYIAVASMAVIASFAYYKCRRFKVK